MTGTIELRCRVCEKVWTEDTEAWLARNGGIGHACADHDEQIVRDSAGWFAPKGTTYPERPEIARENARRQEAGGRLLAPLLDSEPGVGG